MSSSSSSLLTTFLLIYIVFVWSHSTIFALNFSSCTTSTNNLTTSAHLSTIRSICKGTPYPDVCFDSLKITISINLNPNIISSLLQTLQIALTEGGKLLDLFNQVQNSGIVEKQRGTMKDCMELHQITMSSLQKSVSRINSRKLADANAFLSASLTNKNTCLEGLDSASGTEKQVLVDSLINSYKHVSNSLSILSGSNPPKGLLGRRLMGFSSWKMHKSVRTMHDDDGSNVLTVAADGSGNFMKITDAINFAPNNSFDRTIVHVKEGVYKENVEIPSYKTNIVLLGDGRDVTIITGSRSVGGGWTTFRSATVAVAGEGFLARDLTFENTAGPENGQAVALRINADFAAVYQCTINGYQDTLYAHSFRQFYRECDIYGTVDFIFGNAASVFQGCNIIAKLPKPGQFIAITAQGRDIPEEDTGISIQNCSILASDELNQSSMNVKSYLGRPWREYSRTVYLESYIDDFIDPAGWKQWSGDMGLDKLYYGEYENSGPGSMTENRVTWLGHHVMDYSDAAIFKCEELRKHGASVAETPAAVMKKCKYTIGMLSDPPAALSVVFDKGGVLEEICDGKGYIDMSTVDADTSSKINEAIKQKSGQFLEAPVSGSKKPAEDGQLIILAAGERALFDEGTPAFDVMGKKCFFLGEVGNGAKMKLVVNMIMGSMMNAFSEGLVLADKSGLSQETLLDVVELGAIANPMFKLKGPSMIKNNYPPAFPLKHQQKDMRLALALGDENAVSMPIAAAANEAFKKARSLGLGDDDFSAVHEAVKLPESSK